MNKTVFTAKLLIDGTGKSPLHDPFVFVEDGRIQAIGTGRPPEELAQQSAQVNLPVATVIPGLVDAHVHLALGLHLPDWAAINTDPSRMTLLAAHGAAEALRAGVTTIGDCGARYGVTISLREAIATGQVPGSRLWACGTWLTITNGHGYFWTEWGLDNADELRRGVRQMVWQGADFCKIMASGGMTGGAKTNRRRAQYSVEELRAAVEDAHRLNKRVHCHINATEAMRNCIEASVDVLEHCNWLGREEGTVEYDDQLARLGGKKGLFAGINGGDGFMLLQSRDGYAQDWGTLTRWDLFRRMQDAGIRIFIDTDAIGQGFDGLPRIMQRMVAEERASAAEIIAMATLIPAQAMGLAHKIGSLEVGKLADMLFLPANPLEDMSAVTRPLAVVKEGVTVVRDGKIIS
jgi:imidazolonepropionase-like amidohydrolase